MKGYFTMSVKEINRVSIMKKLIKKELKQKQAAAIMGLSVRQVRRLKKRYQQEGPSGLVHKRRGSKSNRRIPSDEVNRIIEIVKNSYWDFGPTLALEKLKENHQVSISRETLRKAMIENSLWKPKRKKRIRIHQLRPRRSCLGELVQLDGSPHAWFENRGPRCDLLSYIDDATGKIMWLEFFKSETTKAYFKSTKGYLEKYGKPLAFYTDKHSVFRINTNKNGLSSVNDSQGLTQYGRAMKKLGIILIPAHSPQAKGRVERLFKTLQDRLVKELRLKGISDMKKANNYLPEFIKQFNDKFAVKPKSSQDVHLPLSSLEKKNIDKILSFQYLRILSKNLTCQFENKIYQIKTKRPTYTMRHAPVLIIRNLKGEIVINYKGKNLDYEIVGKYPKQKIINTKQLNNFVDKVKEKRLEKVPWKPPEDHPWRNSFL